MPALTIERAGFGAGTADLGERPNLTQVVIGARAGRPHRRAAGRAARGQRRRRHRRDAGPRRRRAARAPGPTTPGSRPIVMKKGRPAHTVSALADPALAGQVARRAHRGDRARSACGARRWSVGRRRGVQDTVEVDGLPVRVKVSAGRVKVEHDDAARVARRTGRPLREVVALAEQAGRGASGVARGGRRRRHDGRDGRADPAPRPQPRPQPPPRRRHRRRLIHDLLTEPVSDGDLSRVARLTGFSWWRRGVRTGPSRGRGSSGR